MSDDNVSGYAYAAPIYHDLGWHPFPLPAGAKAPPPEGVTGANGRVPTRVDVLSWVDAHNGANIGLRLPDTVVGIDVDDYDGKNGGATLAALEARYGPLPKTWRSSARGSGVSGIMFFRIPAGVVFPGQLGPDVDVIQFHHRYAVVAPSTHPKLGERYRWWTPEEVLAVSPPNVDQLAELPHAWVDALRWRVDERATRALEAPSTTRALEADVDSIADVIRNTHDWHEELLADGWHLAKPGDPSSWVRPGKDPRHGISAVLHEPDGPFVVFSTSVPQLQQAWAINDAGTGWSYSMFGYLAATRYGGDRSECARDYRRQRSDVDRRMLTMRSGARAAVVLAGVDDVEQSTALAVSHLIDWTKFWANDSADEDFVAYPLVPRGRAVALYAPAKAGKSTVVLALVAALATGRPLFDRTYVEPLDVLYLDYEMTEADLQERLVELGYDETCDLSRLHYALMPSLPPLDTRDGAEALTALAAVCGAQLVVVDTFGRATEGDENDADTSRAFYRYTGTALKAAGRAVLRTDHAGKDLAKGQRGSSAKNDDVDVVWQLRRVEHGVSLKRTHSRVSWVPEHVEVGRRFSGETVVWRLLESGDAPLPIGTTECADLLDEMGVALTSGDRKVRALLDERGDSYTRQAVRAALKLRREREAKRLHAARNTLGAPLQTTQKEAQKCADDGAVGAGAGVGTSQADNPWSEGTAHSTAQHGADTRPHDAAAPHLLRGRRSGAPDVDDDEQLVDPV